MRDKDFIFDDGKYVVTLEDNKITATRHGVPWRNLTGDNLVYLMLMEIEELKVALQEQGDE